MKRKKRVLFVGEASHLSTGYSTYHKEVISRLFRTGKYEIAELACYVDFYSEHLNAFPWKIYANNPDNPENKQEFENNIMYQFGCWRFEDVCLDFKPDVVIDIRDYWMLKFEHTSPFRPYYHWAIMPTVDSAPQDEQWIDTYANADSVATYTDFGIDTLRLQGGEQMKLLEAFPPGASLDIYSQTPNKSEHKKKFGFSPNVMIIGTVMRNQIRKLYPDLFHAFHDLLVKCTKDNNELGKKLFLYCHTSYPDSGWDIPLLLKELGIGHKVLFTYACRSCHYAFPAFFSEAKTFCPRCSKYDAYLPNTSHGVSVEHLNAIYNLFDVYVQYAVCEGMGMPAVEAAACGVPVMAVDYSGMSYVLEKTNGIPIAVSRMFRESNTHSYRALPDNQDFISKVYQLLSLPESVRRNKGFSARLGVEENLTWERTTKLWEKLIDERVVESNWGGPPRIHNPNTHVPENLSNAELIKWGIHNILGEPEKVNSYFALRLLRDLNNGYHTETMGGLNMDEASFLGGRTYNKEFSREQALRQMLELCLTRNYWEQRRVGMIKEPVPNFIQAANMAYQGKS